MTDWLYVYVALCVQVIACAAIAMACEDEGVGLPLDPPWHQLLCPGTTAQQLADIAAEVHWLYAVPRLAWLPSLKPE